MDGAGRIVMPGFVDTHRHMWAACGGCACYGDLGRTSTTSSSPTARTSRPNTYTSVRFGLAEAIDSGITTMHAWEHNLQTPRQDLCMLIGYGPGGGYDIYGRLVAEFLPRHLPGNPTIVAQNMPGAGSFVAAKYIDVAPKDGPCSAVSPRRWRSTA